MTQSKLDFDKRRSPGWRSCWGQVFQHENHFRFALRTKTEEAFRLVNTYIRKRLVKLNFPTVMAEHLGHSHNVGIVAAYFGNIALGERAGLIAKANGNIDRF